MKFELNVVFLGRAGRVLVHATLAVGFSTEEITHLTQHEELSKSWRPHFGFSRDSKNKDQLMSVDYGNSHNYTIRRKINPDEDFFGNWAKGHPKQIKQHYDFGCLDMKSGKRLSCKNDLRGFFCARYFQFDGDRAPAWIDPEKEYSIWS